jgi:hypothetical protein
VSITKPGGEKPKTNLRKAFEEAGNLIGLGSAAALSLALLNPLPLLAGLVAEAAYLLFVPDSSWYLNRLSEQEDAEIQARREALKAQVFPEIAEAVRGRFERLENLRAQIGNQPDFKGQKWFRQVVRRLDYLLEKFLLFARKESQFWKYLLTVRRETVPNFRFEADADTRAVAATGRREGKRAARWEDFRAAEEFPDTSRPVFNDLARQSVAAVREKYDDEINAVRNKIIDETDRNTQAILEKRIDVLKQRQEYVEKIGKILTNLGHQMDLLEDSFGLISDQIRARPPEQVLADIEGVVYQTDSMTKLLEELAPYDAAGR